MIAVISHDAGGAEILSSHVRRKRLRCLFALEGPARSVFTSKLGAIECLALERAIEQASWVLCGTSWQSDLEWRALRLAREVGKYAVAFVDHWVNYRERFQRAGVECLPDEIWVGDNYAARIARSRFGDLPVRVVGNAYLDDVSDELEALGRATTRQDLRPVVLYVCEPIREHALRQHGNERFWGYVEEEALEYFLDNLHLIAQDVARLVMRPHPSESKEKYSWVASRCGIPVETSVTATLTRDVASADIVVGCESMAMLVGLIAGKRVISSIPPGGRKCLLPHAGIESLSDLVKIRRTQIDPARGQRERTY